MQGIRKTVVAVATAILAAGAAGAASYRVFPVPVASPDHGAQALVTDPQQAEASPFGWHDTNGAAGPEFTILRGNNAVVYTDTDADDAPDDSGPDGGPTLLFDFAWSPADPPASYKDALATNAFYWVNMLHDIFYRHGFDELAGNMQQNNYGRGGLGADPVIVEILDGSGTNGADGSYTSDGTSPRIQLREWTTTAPRREGSFDATILIYAWGMAVNGRIAGPACVSNLESPGSGYDDFFALLLTTDFTTATPTQPRGIGTYVLGQPVTGSGLRGLSYTTDLEADHYTYQDTRILSSPQDTGTVWASALWDLTWSLVDAYGASNDWFDGNGAENRMLRLAIRALQRQTCAAGFVEARDAWLTADAELYTGENRCRIWNAFARRGLGFSAVQGLGTSNSDNTAAFDLPQECLPDPLFADGFETP
ncbi:M36 family metallopeptidase [Tahibacter caeni]|uniref:M36 family metallopeptidase n=1 Tax=Tahibacter caeni TaxID=1453545 RepID=UPI0021481C0F|nr:M36 family metallopeptidase [Tahibacter caeni]